MTHVSSDKFFNSICCRQIDRTQSARSILYQLILVIHFYFLFILLGFGFLFLNFSGCHKIIVHKFSFLLSLCENLKYSVNAYRLINFIKKYISFLSQHQWTSACLYRSLWRGNFSSSCVQSTHREHHILYDVSQFRRTSSLLSLFEHARLTTQ